MFLSSLFFFTPYFWKKLRFELITHTPKQLVRVWLCVLQLRVLGICCRRDTKDWFSFLHPLHPHILELPNMGRMCRAYKLKDEQNLKKSEKKEKKHPPEGIFTSSFFFSAQFLESCQVKNKKLKQKGKPVPRRDPFTQRDILQFVAYEELGSIVLRIQLLLF